MYNKVMIKAAIFATIFSICSITGVILFEYFTPKNNMEMIQSEGNEIPEITEHILPDKIELPIVKSDLDAAHFCIPISQGITLDQITITNDYMNKGILISIEGIPSKWWDKNIVKSDGTEVLKASWAQNEERMEIQLQLTSIYEYNVAIKNNSIQLTFFKPREQYDKIVLLDVAHGGTDIGARRGTIREKIVVHEIAKQVAEQLGLSGYKVYLTRYDDTSVSIDKRIQFTNELDPDLMVSIHLDELEQEDHSGISAEYNEQYFIPYLGNNELTAVLSRELAASIHSKVVSMEPTKDLLLKGVKVPSTRISVGQLSNIKDYKLLQEEDHITRIVTGICNGIEASYREKDKRMQEDN